MKKLFGQFFSKNKIHKMKNYVVNILFGKQNFWIQLLKIVILFSCLSDYFIRIL